MKYLKYTKSGYKLIIVFSLLLLASTSCTNKMKDLNEDQKLITDKMLEMDANEGGYTLPGMQLNIVDVLTIWRYEMEQTLSADNYCGYQGLPINAMNNTNTHTYAMVDSWNNEIWIVPASGVLDPWLQMKKKGFETKYPDLYSIAIIFKTFAGHRLVDTFGPIPYSLYGTSSDPAFDAPVDAYNLFFTELTSAVATLEKAQADNPTAYQIRYAKFDKSTYGGNYATWIKVANTLRLRLAMRISKVNPAKAQTEAEAAVNDSYGVLTSNEGSFQMTTGTSHPLVTITSAWQETRINASLESFLGGYNDPRLPVYAKPSTLPGDSIKGIRSGAELTTGSHMGFSQDNFDNNPYIKLMDVAESYFLRAEGALRGWNMGGTAKDFYEQGIRASFNSNKVAGIEDYLNNSTSTPRYYADPINPVNNAAPLTSITVKWDESATFEQKLERIITQKWIAMFPEGTEAWSEFRRTGYPRLWPVVRNYSDGVVPDGQFIKRVSYPSAVTNASKIGVAAAVTSYLNGHDDIYQRLFWDVE